MPESIAAAAIAQVIPASTTAKGSQPSLKDLARGFIASLGTTAVLLKGLEEAYRHTSGQGLSAQTYILTFAAWFALVTVRQYFTRPNSERMFDIQSLHGVANYLHSRGEYDDASVVLKAVDHLEKSK